MSLFKKKSLAIANIVYWFLLIYIIAGMVWWFIALQQQSRQMINYKLTELKADDPLYLNKIEKLTAEENRKTAQYVGEGITFLLLILVGALFVYRAVRKQIRLSQQQQNFMMAITHELKTPIAVAQLNIETLQKHQLEPAKQQQLLNKTLLEINRLDALANNVLVSSQLEGRHYKIAREEMDLSALANKCAQDFKHRFPNRPWHIDMEDELFIKGDAQLLQILINNLLDNAVKYSPKESPIYLSLQQKNNAIILQVKDEGMGIVTEERKKIFDRFYRIGNENTRGTKGTGLGLYLCKIIAKDHNADIVMTDNVPAGSNFAVYFKAE